ncbi:divalent metal cation transporter, partial [Crocinitomicaceae bacterium]|nr:divalent metal cation transporter [Crocinitomicaceae bacterium]
AVTSGFLQNLFGLTEFGITATLGLFTICSGILIVGKYNILDSLIKVIGGVLLLSTLLAFFLAIIQGPNPPIEGFESSSLTANASIMFIIALMGWMPTAVDLSTWNSLWTIERIKQTGYKPTLRETLRDFNFGYVISALLSLCFVTLGAYMLYGSGTVIPDGAAAFSHSIVGMFTEFIGQWSYIIIAAASFSIMFGTCIAVFDGYGRSLQRTTELFFQQNTIRTFGNVYSVSILIVALGSFALIYFFSNHLKSLVDLAMTISFLIAPLVAIVNFRLVTGQYVEEQYKPKVWLKVLSWMGIVFLLGFAVCYVWVVFGS